MEIFGTGRNIPTFAIIPLLISQLNLAYTHHFPYIRADWVCLSGDHTKEASDLGLPFVAVGFLYQLGYFRQRLDHSGWQEAIYPPLNPDEVALQPVPCDDDRECRTITMPVGNREVSYTDLGSAASGGRVCYLMDADLEDNAPWDRQLTARLYGGDREMRIQQEILLGIGGVRVLRELGISPRVWHINEGHSAFMLLERMREYMSQGISFEEAKARVQGQHGLHDPHAGSGWARCLFIWSGG